MDRQVAAYLEETFTKEPEDALLMVAEDVGGVPLGFAHLRTERDFCTRERLAHVSDVVVRASAEGRRIGTILLQGAERWAVGRGYRLLSLNVFDANRRARSVYERFGFLPDTVRLVKEVSTIASAGLAL